jgi:DNA modification methylase
MTYQLINASVLDGLNEIEENSLDGCFCDPPYGLRFMQQRWDYQVPSIDEWKAILRVLKPGAPILAFGGTRTYHRLVSNMEDAGAELRDCLMWITGQGFPKSSNLGDGFGSALKPAYEPVSLARKPFRGTLKANFEEWQTGGLRIDDCRVKRDADDVSGWSQSGSKASPNLAMSGANYDRAPKPDNGGRWPANLILSHSVDCRETGTRKVKTGTAIRHNSGGKNIHSDTRKPSLPDMGYAEDGTETIAQWSCAPDCPIGILNQQAPNCPGSNAPGIHAAGYAGGLFASIDSQAFYGDTGAASRFFYCAKVSKKERGEGNTHPTLKPIALCTYLSRLILSPSPTATLLVPWCGTGSEMIGAVKAGWSNVIGIEKEAEYIEMAKSRLER